MEAILGCEPFQSTGLGADNMMPVAMFTLKSTENDEPVPIRVVVSMITIALQGWQNRTADPAHIARAALPQIEATVRRLNAIQPLTITLTNEMLNAAASPVKECTWLKMEDTGGKCRVGGNDDRTTPPLCSGCGVPDSRVICSHFAHPVVDLDVAMGKGKSRKLMVFFCDRGQAETNGGQCIPGGKACWERTVLDATAPVATTIATHGMIADEIDFLNLATRLLIPAIDRLVLIRQARSISELSGAADTEVSFSRKVTVLADLLDGIRAREFLPAEDQKDKSGHPKGALVALGELLKSHGVDVNAEIGRLRAVRSLRNCFPVHSATEPLLKGLQSLGIRSGFPPADFDQLWKTVLTAAWESLREIRYAVQSAATQQTN